VLSVRFASDALRQPEICKQPVCETHAFSTTS
jgi:hypothetical protein